MGSFSIWHWIIVLVVVLLLFGKGRVPELMADLARGIKSFRKGMMEDSDEDPIEMTTRSKKKRKGQSKK